MKKIRVGLYWNVDWHHMEVTKMLGNNECEITETWISEDTGEDCKDVETYKIVADGDEEYVYAVGYEQYAKPGSDEYSWWARKYATGATNWEPEEETTTKEEDKEMADKNVAQITQIDIDGVRYTSTRPGYYYKKVDGKQTRIPKAEWEQVFDKWQAKVDAEEAEAKKAILDDEMAKLGYTPISSEWNDFRYSNDAHQVMAWDTVYEGMEWVEQQKQDKSDKEAEDAVNGKKAKKTRRPKDIAHESHGKTLTSKQVDFIRHIPDTCFYENGLESTMWCDVLADEIGGQFAGKPMTVGAMISTLREKDLIYVQTEKVNGKKSKYFGFTDLGKEIAKELGLN